MHVTHAILNLKCTRLLEWSHALLSVHALYVCLRSCRLHITYIHVTWTTYNFILELVHRSLTASR